MKMGMFLLAFLAYFAYMDSSHGTQLFSKTLAGKHIVLDADGKDTIGTIKTKIQEKEGIPKEQQTLALFDGKQLEADDEKHQQQEDYKIQKESTPQLLKSGSYPNNTDGQNKKMLIIVEYRRCITPDNCADREIELDVYDSERIIDVKEKINLRLDLLPSEQILYKGINDQQQLADQLPLAECCRNRHRNGCRIGLVFDYNRGAGNNTSCTRGREGKMFIKVFHREQLARTQIHQVIELDAYKTETIDDLKEKIEQRTGIPREEQNLYKHNYGGPELEDGDATLEESGIRDFHRMALIVE